MVATSRTRRSRERGETMTEVYTTGSWKPTQGSEEAFVEAWSTFATWASEMPGAGTLRLVRDLHEPGRFVSFGSWESIDQVKAWKGSPEFRERMGLVLQHVDDFQPTQLALVSTAESGSVSAQPVSRAG
jgi:heme-degrading monooxygenase HmoA